MARAFQHGVWVVKTWLITITLAGLLLLAVLGTGRWLLHSPAGTHWLLTRLAAAQDIKIGRIEGTLVGQLQLSDILLDRSSGQLRCDRVLLTSLLRSYLPLHLDIEQLRVERLEVNSLPVEKNQPTPLPSWPEAPWWLGLLQVDLRLLELLEVNWQQEGQQKLRIERFQGAVFWRDSSLQAQKLFVQTPDLLADSSFQWHFERPALNLELRAKQLNTTKPWQRLHLSGELLPTTDERLFSGPLRLTLAGAEEELLHASVELGLSKEKLHFHQLRLTRPGRSGSVVADGSWRFIGAAEALSARLQLKELDLQVETGQEIRLSGLVNITGGLNRFDGDFQLQNRGAKWLQANLNGEFSGNQTQLKLADLSGSWLNGTLSGQAQAVWDRGWKLQVRLYGRDFSALQLHDRLDGRLNLDLQADIGQEQQAVTGQLQLQLIDSLLHGQPISGDASLVLKDRQLDITHLNLFGEGLLLQASGNPAEQLQMSWRIDRLQQLLTDVGGRLHGDGWLRWQPDGIRAEFATQGEQLRYRQWQLAKLRLQGQTGFNDRRWRLQLTGQQLHSRQLKLATLRLALLGDVERHELQLNLEQGEASLSGKFVGEWQTSRWQGKLTTLQGEDTRLGRWQLREPVPLLLSAEQFRLAPLRLESQTAGSLQLQGHYLPNSRQAEGQLSWEEIDLRLLRPWLSEWEVSGQSSGSVALQTAEPPRLQASMSLTGRLKGHALSLALQRSEWRLDWDEQGLRGSSQLQLADGSRLQVNLDSADRAQLGWPQRGALQFTGQGFALEHLQPWLPPALKIGGQLDWQASGRWQPGAPWQLEGTAKTSKSHLKLPESGGIEAISSAELSWRWQQRLQGDFILQLQDLGSIRTRFDLPLAAELPFRPRLADPVRVEVNGDLQELGLLSHFSPGHLQDTHGSIKLASQVTGSWEKPLLQGSARLFEAGVFLPTLGIQLNDIDLSAEFAERQIEIKNLRLISGNGQLNAQGAIELIGWRPESYHLLFSGENFQLVNLPELQALVNPDLSLVGNLDSYRLRGKLEVPQLLITGKQKSTLASNSPDLLLLDAEVPSERRFRLRHDIDVQLIFGDQVLLNSAGIDAKLAGSLRLQSTVEQQLSATGEIHVVKGKYASYGVNLDISRGNLFFSGGPPERPTLDILALRTVGEVQAGVKVTGTPQLPTVRLYSEPGMAETEILSYIVLGRPLDADSSQTGLLLTAAGALLSQGESVTLQEKLKNRLGLDVLDISAGNGDVTSSVITTGKYLSPDLYISLGYSLFSNTNEMKVRYNLTPDWEIESSIGAESGVDLFYKIDIQ